MMIFIKYLNYNIDVNNIMKYEFYDNVLMGTKTTQNVSLCIAAACYTIEIENLMEKVL